MTINRRHFLRSSAYSLGTLGLAQFGLKQAFAADAATTIRMQAPWINDAEFIGYAIAKQLGLYKKQGITNEYLSGGPDVIIIASLLSNKCDVALGTPFDAAMAVSKQGAKLKIIGSQYQINPLGLISLSDNPVHSPQDLEGKVLATANQNRLLVTGIMKANNLKNVRIIPYHNDPSILTSGSADCLMDFITTAPYTIEQQGHTVVKATLTDLGMPIFNDCFIVQEDVLASKRDALIKWMRASREGWVENAKDLKKYPQLLKDTWLAGTGLPIEMNIYQNINQQPLISSPNGVFSMSDEDIASNLKTLSLMGANADEALFDTSLLKEI